MSVSFGVGTLFILTNNLLTGGVITTGSSGGAAERLQVSSGLIMIDGITATLSAQSAAIGSVLTGGINTGSGLMIYAYIAANDTTTASIACASATDPINTAIGIPTAICPLAKFSFGTGAVSVGSIVAWSGGSATKTIAKVQNVSINISSENQQMRGGGDLFPVDTQFFDSKCEGSFEFADETATQLLFFGGQYSSGGAASGTWTLSGNSKPEPVSLVFQNVTNGITAAYSIMRAYLSQSSMQFGRTDYYQPSYNFLSQSNIKGTVATIQK